MTKKDKENNRVFVYIDGLNFYYSIKRLGNNNLKWLDISKLAKTLAESHEILRKGTITKIKYFTAIVKGAEKESRQINYNSAIQRACNNLEIIKGRFIGKPISCKKCDNKYTAYEEKETDVNIACHLMEDMYENRMDIALVISGDGDLIPPIQRVQKKKKIVVVGKMPKQRGYHIEESANYSIRISERIIKKCILPEEIQGFKKPPEWS